MHEMHHQALLGNRSKFTPRQTALIPINIGWFLTDIAIFACQQLKVYLVVLLLSDIKVISL